MLSLPMLGTVFSHGYVVSGFIPTRRAYPSLASILSGVRAEESSHMMIEAFADSLNPVERSTVKHALDTSSEQFFKSILQKLIAILSRYRSRVSPETIILRSQLISLSRCEFHIKPLAAMSAISSGTPENQIHFWDSFSIEELYTLYTTISCTPEKVLNILEEPIFSNECETREFGFLQHFVRDMKCAEIRHLLRFTTGSSAFLAGNISVIFITIKGLARRPIAHT